MAKVPEMNLDFARYYVETFMDEGETRAARWKGVVETAASASHVTVEVLVRLAFATTASAGGAKNESLQATYQGVLGTISGDGVQLNPVLSKRELQVLAAAVLEQLFLRLPDAAIAVTTTSFNGMRTAELPMDLAAIACAALITLSKKNHTRPDAKDLEILVPKVEFEVSAEALASLDASQWKLELDRLRNGAQAATRSIVEGQNKVVKELSRQMTLGDEELQMLWWLIGEHSSVANRKFAKVDEALKPFAFGQELGELAEISPGPASVAALLARAGVGEKSLKIQDAVNACDAAWVGGVTTSTRISPVTTPLHFALEKRAEVGALDAWQASWAAMTGLDADASVPGVKLAELYYREHLFLYVGG